MSKRRDEAPTLQFAPQWLTPGQAGTRSQGSSPGVPHGWQGPSPCGQQHCSLGYTLTRNWKQQWSQERKPGIPGAAVSNPTAAFTAGPNASSWSPEQPPRAPHRTAMSSFHQVKYCFRYI